MNNLYFSDYTFSSVLRCCNNSICNTMINANRTLIENTTKCYELSGLQDISPTGFFWSNQNIIIVLVLSGLLIFLVFAKTSRTQRK
jgi:hypothetical protein